MEIRPYHRFLWRELYNTKEPEVYEFKRLPYGNTASPFCAQHVLHFHAETSKELYPEAADTVDNAMYVDDLLDSYEAKDLRNQTTKLLSGAGFTSKNGCQAGLEIDNGPPSRPWQFHGRPTEIWSHFK